MKLKNLKLEKMFEGGAATKDSGTQRASKVDIERLVNELSNTIDLTAEDIRSQIVGSGQLVLNSEQNDAGDIDLILTSESQNNKDEIIQKLSTKFGNPKKIGDSIFSFAVGVQDDKKVQLDIMFVASLEWGKFSYHADPESKYKSGVRNELIHAVLKNSMQSGKDIIVKNDDGDIIAKVARSFYLNSGMKRVFKIAHKRSDGTGFVKHLSHAKPEEIRQLLDSYGVKNEFSTSTEETVVPEKFVSEVFGDGVTVDDVSSAEKIIQLIKSKFQSKSSKIFADAKRGMTKRKFEIPSEMK